MEKSLKLVSSHVTMTSPFPTSVHHSPWPIQVTGLHFDRLTWPSSCHGLRHTGNAYLLEFYGMYMVSQMVCLHSFLFPIQIRNTSKNTELFQIGQATAKARANGQPTHPAQDLNSPVQSTDTPSIISSKTGSSIQPETVTRGSSIRAVCTAVSPPKWFQMRKKQNIKFCVSTASCADGSVNRKKGDHFFLFPFHLSISGFGQLDAHILFVLLGNWFSITSWTPMLASPEKARLLSKPRIWRTVT